MPLLRLAIQGYRGPRRVQYNRMVGPPIKPNCGVGAGCVLAMFLVTLYCLDSLRSYRTIHRHVPLTLYVDDVHFQCVGTKLEIHLHITGACKFWLNITQNDLHCTIHPDKAVVIASSPELAADIRHTLQEYGGKETSVAEFLGADAHAGQSATGLPFTHKRINKVYEQAPRLQRVHHALQSSARNCALQGLAPRGMSTAPVRGVPPAMLHQMRTTMGAATGPSSRLTSLTIKLHLGKLEIEGIAICAPMLRYASESWHAFLQSIEPALHPRSTMAIHTARLHYGWRTVAPYLATQQIAHGPFCAAALAAYHAGWDVEHPSRWTQEHGKK